MSLGRQIQNSQGLTTLSLQIILSGDMEKIIWSTDSNGHSDRYLSEFSRRGLLAIRVPTQKFIFVNEDILISKLESMSNENSDNGLVITSPRAVTALGEALANRKLSKSWLNGIFQEELVFAVGEHTAQLISDKLGLNICNNSQLSGNGPELVKSMEELLSNRERSQQVYLMHPCGQLAGNQIESISSKLPQVRIEKVVVYESVGLPNLEISIIEGLVEYLKLADRTEIELNLIFFAPSVVKMIRAEFLAHKLSNLYPTCRFKFRYSAIGPTTSSYMIEQGIDLYAVSEKPTPSCLVDAIQTASSRG